MYGNGDAAADAAGGLIASKFGKWASVQKERMAIQPVFGVAVVASCGI
jgi:hypothetical protein